MVQSQEPWLSKIIDKDYFISISTPSFLELDGLIILEAHYSSESFEVWKKKLATSNSPADLQKLENTINHVHLDDLVNKESLQIELGEYLRKIWIRVLNTQFPNYNFECELKPFEDGWELVVWKQR